MKDLAWMDRNSAEQLDRHLFRPLDTEDVVLRSGRTEVDPDEVLIRFSDDRYGGTFADAVEDMATDHGDRANPSGRYCETASQESYTIGLSAADDPDRILAMMTVGYEVSSDTLDIGIHMIFTDAEFRGEGFGHLLAGGAILMSERMLAEWPRLDGTTGTLPSHVTLWGEPVSEGGLALMEKIRDASCEALSARMKSGDLDISPM
ncbi:hypothetical protein LCGC14_0227990 [marine sediment metagenome]|uniref:Uncharacterized protein n=1 Tax=marine sediment metagenome TaxID=412755 RepID=A0A0F9UB73_9ZZZZ